MLVPTINALGLILMGCIAFIGGMMYVRSHRQQNRITAQGIEIERLEKELAEMTRRNANQADNILHALEQNDRLFKNLKRLRRDEQIRNRFPSFTDSNHEPMLYDHEWDVQFGEED